jgi:DNA polymerase-3 subunit epsilon
MLTLQRPLVILDLEATGTDPEQARIIQVAATRLVPRDGQPKRAATLSTVVNPGIPVPARIRDLTGITQSDLDDAPPWAVVADRVGSVIEDADLAGYKIRSYDLPLLEAEYARLNREVPGPSDRTVVDAYAIETQLRPRTLESVYRRRTGKDLKDAHDAAADVKATLSVLSDQSREVMQRLFGDGPPADVKPSPDALADYARGDYLDDGRKLREREDGSVEICFGKHSGKTLTELADSDPGYLDWMYSEITELQPFIDEALPDRGSPGPADTSDTFA